MSQARSASALPNKSVADERSVCLDPDQVDAVGQGLVCRLQVFGRQPTLFARFESWTKARGSRFVRVVEDAFQRHVEGSSDLEGHFERGGVFATFDGVHRLPRDANALAEFCLTYATHRSQVGDPIGDFGRLCHRQALRR